MAAAAEKLMITRPEKPPSTRTKQPMSGLRLVLVMRCTMPEYWIWHCVATWSTRETELQRLISTSSVPWTMGCWRSEEHTSELQSHSDLVCRLLLEKKTTPTDAAVGTATLHKTYA